MLFSKRMMNVGPIGLDLNVQVKVLGSRIR